MSSPAERSAGADGPIPLAGIEDYRALEGRGPRRSPYLRIDQRMIDRFADLIDDHQWIHVDAERAARESPYGRTVAHGFLTLSLLSRLLHTVFDYPGRKTSINYGFDRIRFTAPVLVDSDVRAAVAIADVVVLGDAELRVCWDVALEVAGAQRPALVARWLVQMAY